MKLLLVQIICGTNFKNIGSTRGHSTAPLESDSNGRFKSIKSPRSGIVIWWYE